MVGSARVAEMEAQSKMDVAVGQAKGDLEVATAEGNKEAERIVRQATIASNERKVKVDQTANVKVLESEAILKSNENHSQALIATAEAEDKSTAGLEVKRKYELEWERLSILSSLSTKGRRFISGQLGQQLLQDMVPTAIDTKSKGGMF